MRIPSGTTDQVIYFVALDATDLKTRETGLTTFTVYRSRNGGASTAMTTPTVTEVDATNMPGVYKLLLDEDMTIAAGNDSEEMIFHITHTGMAPVDRTIELYRPKITEGRTLIVSSIGALGAGTIQPDTMSSDAIGAVNIAADVSAEIADAVWDEARSGHVTAGTFGERVNADVTMWRGSQPLTLSNSLVRTRLDQWLASTPIALNGFGYLPVDVASIEESFTPTADIADAVLDEVYEGTTTLRQFLRLAASVLWGKLSGAATTTIAIRDEADTKDRISATVDSDGNRSAITLDKT